MCNKSITNRIDDIEYHIDNLRESLIDQIKFACAIATILEKMGYETCEAKYAEYISDEYTLIDHVQGWNIYKKNKALKGEKKLAEKGKKK